MVPLFAVTTWSIRHHQNKSRIQEHSLPLERIASFAEDYLRGFKTLDRPKQKTRRTVLKKWSPPILGSLKTNFDGAMFGESDEAGLRVVICNSEGEIMATLSGNKKKKTICGDLGVAGSSSCSGVFSQSGFPSSTFEGDSETIIKDILSYTNSFQSYYFSHVVRQGNEVVYALAQRARLIIYSFRSLDGIYSTKYLLFCLV